MPITILVRSTQGAESRLTFDGTQRVVLGRGAGCDVRLPDPSVSQRHATLRAQGADFLLVDEASTNGTFVGGVRIAPRTSRIVRSGDVARLGRVAIELRIDQNAITRDVAAATRDLALALVASALDAAGADPTLRVSVVEGADQGADLPLSQEGRPYVTGRGAECDLPLADADASREHAAVVRRGALVFVRDLRAKNGTWLADQRLPPGQEVPWRATQMVRVGRTVLALREPIGEALARIEQAPDEPMPEVAASAASETAPTPAPPFPAAAASAPAPVVAVQSGAPARPRRGWSPLDLLVMATAVAVLALSLAGLVWLLRD